MPRTLREQLRQGPLDFSTARHVLRQVLQALTFAHWREIDHGPITPESVVFTRGIRVRPASHGLEIPRHVLRSAGEPVDVDDEEPQPTPAIDPEAVEAAAPFYLSPEEIAGEECDECSDVFAVGILFYEMLTGKHPFGASEGLSPSEVQERILNEPPEPVPPGILAGLQPRFISTLKQALAKDRDKRFPDALSFLDALDAPAGHPQTAKADDRGARQTGGGGRAGRSPDRSVVSSTRPDAVHGRPPPSATKVDRGMAGPPGPEGDGRRRSLRYAAVAAITLVVVVAVVVTLLLLDGRSDSSAESTDMTTAGVSSVPATTPSTVSVVPTSVSSTSSTSTTSTTEAFAPVYDQTTYEDDDPLLAYSGTWTRSRDPAASGGSFVFADSAGAAVTITFEGTHLAWVAKRSPVYGLAEVTLDGNELGAVDLYSSEAQFEQKVWGSGELAPGLHTVTITWTGQKNGAATETNIGVDRFEVIGTLVEAE